MKITRSQLKQLIVEELQAVTEDGHEDVPSAARKLKTAIEDATEILQGLQASGGDLPSWWMSKITLASDYLNKCRDYLLVDGEVMQEGYYSKGKCVYKKEDDTKVGCTDGPVEDYMKALYANVPDAKGK